MRVEVQAETNGTNNKHEQSNSRSKFVLLDPPTVMFCSLSLLFAVALVNSPYFASSVLRRLVGGTTFFLVSMLFAVVLDYCLSFPSTKKIIARRAWLRQAIYIVGGAFGVMVATIFITTPVMTPVRSMLLSLAFGIVSVVTYCSP